MNAAYAEEQTLPLVRVDAIAAQDAGPAWLIDQLWGAAAVGLIGGHPKCGKTWLGLDLAVSVASGTACLGFYPVHQPGPVLVYLAEDTLVMVRQRVEAMARQRGLPLAALDLHAITAPRLRLDDPRDHDRLVRTVQALRPRLLLLDPLVRLHQANENDAAEMARLLSGLRELQKCFQTAVAVVHHVRKNGGGAHPGQGLRGSSVSFRQPCKILRQPSCRHRQAGSAASRVLGLRRGIHDGDLRRSPRPVRRSGSN